MNREETEQAIKVMQAWLEGKQIQTDDSHDKPWEYVKNPQWQWGTRNYRIKPEPREFWIVGANIYHSKGTAERFHTTPPIHVREVIDD